MNKIVLLILGLLLISSVSALTFSNGRAYCYQETINVSTSIDGNCSLNYTGIYQSWGNWSTIPMSWVYRAYDGDWSTQAIALGLTGTYGTINFTYIKPNNALINGAIWSVKDGNNTVNLTILDSCYQYSATNISLRFIERYQNPTAAEWYCYNGSWNLLRNVTNQHSIYEEGIYWDLNNSIIVNSQTYNTSTYETNYETYTINLSYDSVYYPQIEANLYYDGTFRDTVYSTGSGNEAIFTDMFAMPLISTESNKSFYWVISLINSSSMVEETATTLNQTVKTINLTECGVTRSLNFTAYDQSTVARIASYDFKGTFNYFITSSDLSKNISFNNLSINELDICIIPNTTFYIDATIEYTAPNYQVNHYYFNNFPINNVSQSIQLFLLNSSDSTSFIIKVQDYNLLPLNDYDVEIYRYYPGTDTYLLSQIVRTDEDGKSVAFFVTETVDYKFIIKDENGTIVLTTDKRKIIPETTPYTIMFTIGEDLGSPWSFAENLTGLTYSIYFNHTTNITTLTYLDTNTSFSLSRLIIKKLNYSGDNNLVCNTSSAISGWTLTCDLTGNSTGTYTALYYLTRGSTSYLVTQYIFEIEDFTSKVGMLGVLGAFFIILISCFAFAYNESAGIIMVNLSVIFVNVIKLVNFGLVFITGMIAVSILILIVMEKR